MVITAKCCLIASVVAAPASAVLVWPAVTSTCMRFGPPKALYAAQTLDGGQAVSISPVGNTILVSLAS